MKKILCDKCGKEITTDVEYVFDYELCFECAEALKNYIVRPTRTAIIDELRDFCKNFSKDCSDCSDCPFYDKVSWNDCIFMRQVCYWPSEEEILSKLLDYKTKHPC